MVKGHKSMIGGKKRDYKTSVEPKSAEPTQRGAHSSYGAAGMDVLGLTMNPARSTLAWKATFSHARPPPACAALPGPRMACPISLMPNEVCLQPLAINHLFIYLIFLDWIIGLEWYF